MMSKSGTWRQKIFSEISWSLRQLQYKEAYENQVRILQIRDRLDIEVSRLVAEGNETGYRAGN